MAGISISGLASGLNWQNIITQLMAAERAPETTLNNQKTANTTKITSLAQIKTDLTTLQTDAQALNDGTIFGGRAASFVNSGTNWTAVAAANTKIGQYTFDVTQIATQSKIAGAADAGGGISSSSTVSDVTISSMNLRTSITAGIFSVNGAQVNIATTDSLQDVFTKISDATNGDVTGSYDPASDTISLKNSNGNIFLGSSADTSNFLSAAGLFNTNSISPTVTSAAKLGVVNLDATLANSHLAGTIKNVDSTGNGTLTINGVQISFNVNTDSMQAVMNRINTSSAGVTASYNKLTDSFSLTSNSTGDVNLSVEEAADGLLQAMGLNGTGTFSRGANAQFSVNGGPVITSQSNTFDPGTTGIDGLTVTASSATSQTINVANDTSNVSTALTNFLTSYNTLQSYIDTQTATSISSNGKPTTSTLSGDYEVSGIASSLRDIFFNSVQGQTGTIQRLDDIGIGFTGMGSQISVTDSAKLNNALLNNPDQVQALFTSQPNGLVAQLNKYINQALSSHGTIATETNSLNTSNQSIDSQIAAIEAKITQDQANLTDEFTAMEAALSKSQSTLQTLNSFFGTSTTSPSASNSSYGTSSTSSSSSSNSSSSTNSSSSSNSTSGTNSSTT